MIGQQLPIQRLASSAMVARRSCSGAAVVLLSAGRQQHIGDGRCGGEGAQQGLADPQLSGAVDQERQAVDRGLPDLLLPESQGDAIGKPPHIQHSLVAYLLERLQGEESWRSIWLPD